MTNSINQEENQDSIADSSAREVSLFALLPEVWAKRKPIAIFVTAATLISVVAVLLQTNLYTAETSILPEPDKGKLLGLTGMSDIAAAAGLSVGESPLSRLYPLIIKSARVMQKVIYARYLTSEMGDSTDLIQFWKIDGNSEEEKFERALTGLRSRVGVTFDNRLGTVIVTVEMEASRLAADVANKITKELDLYTRTKRRTSVIVQREFIEQRLQEVEQSLRTAENTLRSFKEKNRRLGDSPQLLLDQGRLEREVQINSTIFIELKKQIEIAKIEETKNMPLVNVLDTARVPIERSSPRRRQIVVTVFVLSLLFATSVVVAHALPVVENVTRRFKAMKFR